MRLVPLLVTSLASLLLASWAPASDEVITYAGATTLQRDFMPPAAQLFLRQTGIPVRLTGGNSDPGLAAVQTGAVKLAGSGRYLRPEEKRGGLVETLIGWDAIVIGVHRSNPVNNLSLRQLQEIFSGRLVNWRQVGGEDQPILVITSPKGSGMRQAVQHNLGLDSFTPQEITAALVADGDRQVAALPLAICALSQSMADSEEVKIIQVDGLFPTRETVAAQSYPLIKPLLLVTRGKPAGAVARFITMALSDQGQDIMAQKFYPLR
ncbi:MAG: phosphate ABC transporter substrate-binding protein [Desulfuromonadales bacterium]|nr:phosphate ABC transporter substrate-binding protein [Desulfuromonadales bacterium]